MCINSKSPFFTKIIFHHFLLDLSQLKVMDSAHLKILALNKLKFDCMYLLLKKYIK